MYIERDYIYYSYFPTKYTSTSHSLLNIYPCLALHHLEITLSHLVARRGVYDDDVQRAS